MNNMSDVKYIKLLIISVKCELNTGIVYGKEFSKNEYENNVNIIVLII